MIRCLLFLLLLRSLTVGERPNVVFIIADDLGWGELGCYGQQKIPTPNLDRMAAGGMASLNITAVRPSVRRRAAY